MLHYHCKGTLGTPCIAIIFWCNVTEGNKLSVQRRGKLRNYSDWDYWSQLSPNNNVILLAFLNMLLSVLLFIFGRAYYLRTHSLKDKFVVWSINFNL
jgi:hypothetical protein